MQKSNGVNSLLRTVIPVSIAAAVLIPLLFDNSRQTEAGSTSDNPQFEATLMPAAPKPVRNNPKPARLSSSSEFIQMNSHNRYIGEFRLNGRRIKALVDTGASVVAINKSTAQRIGIRTKPSDFIHTANTANGQTRAAMINIDEIEFGRIRVKNVRAMVLDDRSLSSTLIGMTFLNKLGKFSFSDNRLEMRQ